MSTARKLPQEIYLASGGKVFGPYTANEFEAFNLSGDIRKFSWIWDPSSDSWKALDPAPKMKPISGSAAQPGIASTPSSFQAMRSQAVDAIEVICHDFREMLSASLIQMTETGCELISRDLNGHASHPPHFALSAPLMLNLYDPATGKLTNVNGRFYGAERAPDGWKLRIRWDSIPAL